MVRELEKIGTPGVVVLVNVSSVGSGLYLRIPREVWETYGILARDRLEVKIQAHYRARAEEGSS